MLDGIDARMDFVQSRGHIEFSEFYSNWVYKSLSNTLRDHANNHSSLQPRGVFP